MTLATMTPTDIGVTAGALLLLVYAARTMVSKEGQAQMGCGFAVAAAVLWSLALGRRIPDFTTADGLRLALGALLLLPAFRAIFRHGKDSVVSGAVGLVMASVIAGPVVQRYLDRAGILEAPKTPAQQIVKTEEEIERLEGMRLALAGDMAVRKKRINERGISDKEALLRDPEAMQLLREFDGFRTRLVDLEQRLERLREERSKLAAAEADTNRTLTEIELDRIRREVTAASDLSDKSLLEQFSAQQDLGALFEREILGTGK